MRITGGHGYQKNLWTSLSSCWNFELFFSSIKNYMYVTLGSSKTSLPTLQRNISTKVFPWRQKVTIFLHIDIFHWSFLGGIKATMASKIDENMLPFLTTACNLWDSAHGDVHLPGLCASLASPMPMRIFASEQCPSLRSPPLCRRATTTGRRSSSWSCRRGAFSAWERVNTTCCS